MSEDMKGLFFIVKGQYKKGVEPHFINEVSGEKNFIGCFNPESEDTSEWYMLLDNKTFHCVACGGDYDKVLKSVSKVIKKYKGVAKKYFKYLSDTTSEDYYEITYLGHKPLTKDQRAKKVVGRCPRVTPVMKSLYEQVYNEYGDYYREDIENMENEAYEVLKDSTPFKRSRKLMKNKKVVSKPELVVKEQEAQEVLSTPKVKHIKTKLGVKKLSME